MQIIETLSCSVTAPFPIASEQSRREAAEALRRNLVVSGINLAGLRGRAVALGGALLEITGPCAPCSRMEAAFGPGGYAAVRGQGGMTARVLQPGPVSLGDALRPID